jgi:hypothetical protein
MLIHEVPLHDVQVGVWCASSVPRIIEPIPTYPPITNPQQYITHVLTSLFEHLSNYERIYDILQQDSETAHTTNNSICCLQTAVCERVICRGLWPPHSPDVNLCNFYL